MMPNFLLAGAGKAGTTSLYYFLSQHPQIYMSLYKEPKFFSFFGRDPVSLTEREREVRKNAVIYRDEYEELFNAAGEAIAIGEASQMYFADRYAREQIRTLLPLARIIVILRNPVERAYSLYLHFLRDGREQRPLKEALSALPPEENPYLKGGFYAAHLKKWMRDFPQEQLKIVIYDDFVADPTRVTQDIYRFLGVDASFTPDTSLHSNASGVPKGVIAMKIISAVHAVKVHLRRFITGRLRVVLSCLNSSLMSFLLEKPKLSKDIRVLLGNSYNADIWELERLLQRDLSGWLKAEGSIAPLFLKASPASGVGQRDWK